LAPRNCPVEYISVEYSGKPLVCSAILKAIEKADLIVYAPGSLYTSIIPILQLESIASAIRANDRALKYRRQTSGFKKGKRIISLKNQGRGFLVSELIEACDRNVPGGVDDLFHVVLSASWSKSPWTSCATMPLREKSNLSG